MSRAAALADGFQQAFLVGAGLALAGALLSLALLARPMRAPEPAPERA
jgi:hypothetical protein